MASKQPTPRPVKLRERSAAARCHYLAAKLAESGDGDPLAVSLALEILGGEIKGISDKARALVARWEAAQLVHEDAAAFIEAEPDWILAVLAVLREVACD
jgi:hypothetical protein